MDPVAGWKITEFITVSEPFDYSNDQHVEEALKLLRRLHTSGRTVDSVFNIRHEAAKIREKLIGTSQLDLSDLSTLDALQDRLDSYVSRSSDGQCLCHNDFYNPNILVAGSDFYLIDWEYASMSNYASDLGTFICCSTYGYDQALKAFELYFGRVPTREETIHCLAYVSLCGYYWFMWGLNMDAHGETIEADWMHRWYRAAVDFGAIAENMINDASE
jgi:thiamine kinase-like enzyme